MDLDLGMTDEQIFAEADKYRLRIVRKPLLVIKVPRCTRRMEVADSILRAARSLRTVYAHTYRVIMVPKYVDIVVEGTNVVNLTLDANTDFAKLILELEKYADNRKKENK